MRMFLRGAAMALALATAGPASAGSTALTLTGAWTKIAAAGITVDVQTVGGPGPVLLTTASAIPAAGAAGASLPVGEHRTFALALDLYAASAAGATVVVVDGLASGGAAGSSCDATVAAGGTAQVLCGGATPADGWAVYNPNAADDLWCSDSATAVANGSGSVRIVANGGGYETPSGYKPAHALSCLGATTGDAITARRW